MIKAQDYRPSKQVNLVLSMINDFGAVSRGLTEGDRRFGTGTRHGFNLVFRALVELETDIHDPELIDDICADLITESLINRC